MINIIKSTAIMHEMCWIRKRSVRITMTTKTTILEHLPDEIFAEIFEYIPMKNLHQSFSGLNRRINSILSSVPTRLAFRWMRPVEIHNRSVAFFTVRISKLSVCHTGPLNLVHFPNIRHLELERPTSEQCNEIQPHTIPHLECLRINNSHSKLPADTFHRLCCSLFSNEFPRLHTCILINIQFNHQWSEIPCALRSIQIDVRNCQDLSHLLKICPQLVQFKGMLDDQQFDFHHPNICQTLRKLDLYLRINDWSCEDLESLLAVMPNLKSMSIQTPFDQRSCTTVEGLANLLRKSIPKLNSFYIYTMVSKLPSTNDIRQLHPLFKYSRVSQLATTQSEYIVISSKLINE